MNNVEKDLYKIGMIFGVAGIVTIVFLWCTQIDLTELGVPCMFYRITGYYCPGCGGTRAVMSLIHGKVFKSFCYHPLVVYIAGVYLLFMLTNTIQIISHNVIKIGMKYHDIYLYLMIGIIVVNCVIKNLQKLSGINPFCL